jgi:hypothetical protein
MNRHKVFEWIKIQAKPDPAKAGEKLSSLNEIERTGGKPDVVGHDKKQTNTFFMIIRQKVLQVAEVFVRTERLWIRGKNINRKITPLIWQLPWALNF